jgi:DNA-binding response OmpR family regulator
MARILIIEDDSAMRHAMKVPLERSGHQIAEAGDGRAGLAAYKETVFDLVMTDIIMPGMEGLETVLALRKFSPNVKIIAMSAGGKGDADDYLELARRFGAHRTLRKPFTSEEMMSAVTAELGTTP